MSLIFLISQGLVISASAVAGAAMCRKSTAACQTPSLETLLGRAKHLYLVFPLLLLLPGVSVYLAVKPSLHWDLPATLQLHYTTIYWALISGILSYVFAFCCVAAFAMRHRLRWCTTTFAVIVLLGIQLQAWWKARAALPVVSAPRTSRDGVILQSSSSTCVPASGANIAALLQVRTTEKELVERFHTTKEGTYPAQAIAGLKQLGISGRKVTVSSGDIGAVKAPAMLFVLADTHAVVYVGTTNGLAEIWDPGSGKRFLSDKRLRDIWDGHALEFWSSR